MKKYNFNSKNKKYRSERIGFFTAFSVCIIAISLGLWSTYMSIGGLDGNLENETGTESWGQQSPVTEAVDSEVRGIVANGRSSGAEGGEDMGEVSDKGADSASFGADKDSESSTDTSPSEDTEDVDVPDTGVADETQDKLQTIFQVRSSLLYPVASKRVAKEYSEEAVYSKTMEDYRSHNGTDFEASQGEAVFSVCEGIVEEITADTMNGNVVKITNEPYSVYYCGVSDDIAVKEGDFVEAGQVIAQVGDIPCEAEDESHLHMEIRVNENLIDPMTVISNDR